MSQSKSQDPAARQERLYLLIMKMVEEGWDELYPGVFFRLVDEWLVLEG